MIEMKMEFDGARVICYSPIDHRHRQGGTLRRATDGKLMGQVTGLAICYDAEEETYCLMRCDEDWDPIRETEHDTMAEARQQADYEYAGVKRTWIKSEG